MDLNKDNDNIYAEMNSGDFSVDSILAEYKAEEAAALPRTEARDAVSFSVDEQGSDIRSDTITPETFYDAPAKVAAPAPVSAPPSDEFAFLNDESLFGRAEPATEKQPEGGIPASAFEISRADSPPSAAELELIIAEAENGAVAAADATQGEAAPELKSVNETEPLPEGEALMDLFTGGEKSSPEAEAEAPAEAAEDVPAPEGESTPEGEAETSDNEKPAEGQIWEIAPEELSDAEYAAQAVYEAPEKPERAERAPRKKGFMDKVISPVIGLIAMTDMRRREKAQAEKKANEEAKKNLPPEMRPDRAAAMYAAQADSIKPRAILATALCLVLMWLSYGGPAFGVLGTSITARGLVCLILELTVMLIGLDIVTKGMLNLFRKRPNGETLIAISCIVSALDAAILALTANETWGLPFCAASAMSVTAALWGSFLQCKSFAISMLVAGSAKNPSVILSQAGADDSGCALAKQKRSVTGFVRQCESADAFESAFRLFTPFLLIASVILSALCAVCVKGGSFFHILAAVMTITASFSAALGFALPFSFMATRLARSGAAIAGYSGCAELGRVRRVIITDSDVFPARTISIADIFLAEGEFPEKVISYTGSMIAAANMGLSPAFTELMKKNACTMQRVEDFACHEGGGIVARINGDVVYVGSGSYMKLMGIRLPKKAAGGTAVFTAINDSLAGCFSINYVPVSSVQRALVTLLRGRTEPLFAIRDFNVTPMLIKQKFRLPGRTYDFPSFADRYRISSEEELSDGLVSAMFARGGLTAVSGLTTRGRRLYNGTRFCALLAVLGSLIGMVMMFFMCWGDAYLSASVGNTMSFMLLWLVPVGVISLGLRR